MYLALYRKYRPSSFDDVISQEHITTTLKNQIKSGTPAHAYLFTGSRGTGKTTCARLLAMAVNCENPVDGNPCGKCKCCTEIQQGTTTDIIEIDAASNSKVDDIRTLCSEVIYKPTICKYKVYIIDEVHTLSNSNASFEALLKTLEEPPEHVIFILATTEVHKVPATIVSRCQQHRFHRIDIMDSIARLKEIAKAENIDLTEDAAQLIAGISDGGMRDALSLLDQCRAVSERVDNDTVYSIAGVTGVIRIGDIADCVIDHTPGEAVKIFDSLYEESKDPVQFLNELSRYFRNLCVLSSLNQDFSLIPPGSGDKNRLANQSTALTPGEIFRAMDIINEAIATAGKIPQKKTVVELCLIQLCSPQLDNDIKGISRRLEALERKIATGDIKVQQKPEIVIQPRTVTPPAVNSAPEEEPPFDIDPPKAQPVVNTAPEEPPFDIDPPKAQPEPEPQPEEKIPDWLNEGDEAKPENSASAVFQSTATSDEDTIPPWLSEGNEAMASEDIASDELPPIPTETPEDLPPIPTEEPVTTDLSEPLDSYTPPFDDNSSLAQKIAARLKSPTLSGFLQNQRAELTGDVVKIYCESDFQYSMLTVGKGINRISETAAKVIGREVKVEIIDPGKKAKEKDDRLSEFLAKAEKSGVEIKRLKS